MKSQKEIVSDIRKTASKSPGNLKKVLGKYFSDADAEDLHSVFQSTGRLTPADITDKLGNETGSEFDPNVLNSALNDIRHSSGFYPAHWGKGNVILKMLIDLLPHVITNDYLFSGLEKFIEEAEKLYRRTQDDSKYSRLDQLMAAVKQYNGPTDYLKAASVTVNTAEKSGVLKKYMSGMITPQDIASTDFEYYARDDKENSE